MSSNILHIKVSMLVLTFLLIFISSVLSFAQQDSIITNKLILNQDPDSNRTIVIPDSTVTDSVFMEVSKDSTLLDTSAMDQNKDVFVQDSIEVESHPQDISKDAGYFIESAGAGSLRIYGSVRLSGAYDLNGLSTVNSFSTYDIPVGDEATDQARFFMTPNQTRMGIEMKRESFLGEVRVNIETDFLGKNNGLRIRHAFAESGNFLIGQTWSTFTDVNSVPQTVDIDGPNSSVQLRTVRIRYKDRIKELNLHYLVSLESPEPDVAVSDSLDDRIPSQFIPDIAGQIVYNYPWGYLSAAAIFRGITIKDSSQSIEQIAGIGLLAAGVYNIDQRHKFLFQGVYGRAISRFITALSGKGLDLVYNPNSKSFEATRAYGLLVSYAHNWRADITSSFTIGMVGIINKDFEPPDAFSQSWYYSANIFWNPLLGVRLGLELTQGRRINVDNNFGRATRIGFIFYADF